MNPLFMIGFWRLLPRFRAKKYPGAQAPGYGSSPEGAECLEGALDTKAAADAEFFLTEGLGVVRRDVVVALDDLRLVQQVADTREDAHVLADLYLAADVDV